MYSSVNLHLFTILINNTSWKLLFCKLLPVFWFLGLPVKLECPYVMQFLFILYFFADFVTLTKYFSKNTFIWAPLVTRGRIFSYSTQANSCLFFRKKKSNFTHLQIFFRRHNETRRRISLERSYFLACSTSKEKLRVLEKDWKISSECLFWPMYHMKLWSFFGLQICFHFLKCVSWQKLSNINHITLQA